MTANGKTVRIFMIPQQFPCGPGSSCCGPIGQSEEEIQNLKTAMEGELDCRVEVFNAMDWKEMANHPSILRLLRSFGPMALPIIALDGEVVSMGVPSPEEAVSAVREKMNRA
ncbi:MAG: hypothetical protein ACUVXI_18775 [bacterium]